MIVIIILLVVAVFIGIAVEFVNIFEHGTPANDSDILEMLELRAVDYDIDRKWNDKFKLKAHWKSEAPSIHQTQYSIIFPYYIDDVGVVPIWYKSTARIKSIFEAKIAKSKYTVSKRDKLGLNKN